jgi:hypothetical protein
MGAAKFSGQTIEKWSRVIGSNPKSCDKWEEVFGDHPEFFGDCHESNEHRYWLRLRRAKALDPDKNPKEDWKIIKDSHHTSRMLEPSERQALVRIAIDLHARSGDSFTRRRWLVSPILAFLGAIAGTQGPSILAFAVKVVNAAIAFIGRLVNTAIST